MSRQSRKRAIERVRAQEARRRRRRRILVAAGGLLAGGGIATAIVFTTGGGSAAGGAAAGGATAGGATAGGATAGGSSAAKLSPLSTLGTLQSAPAPGATGSEGVPVPSAAPLTGTTTKAAGQPVDGSPATRASRRSSIFTRT